MIQAMQFNSDKYEKGLFDFYDEIFTRYSISGTLLEIGVLHGGSLLWFKNTGRFEQIVGADIKLPKNDFGAGIYLHKLDQSSRPELDDMIKQYTDWNVVIDDGSHELEHVITTFDALWPHTRDIYIIEDWDVAYHCHRFNDWNAWISELWRKKRELGAQEIRVVFDENPLSYHGYIMLRRG